MTWPTYIMQWLPQTDLVNILIDFLKEIKIFFPLVMRTLNNFLNFYKNFLGNEPSSPSAKEKF